MITRAQYILNEISMADLPSNDTLFKGTLGAVIAGSASQIAMTQHLRNKYALHPHIQHHRDMAAAIKTNLPPEEQHLAHRLLKNQTIGQMAAQIQHNREAEGGTVSPGKSYRTAKRAFHGTFTGTRLIGRNTPAYGLTT